MASPKIESTETRLTTKGLFPILNTLGKGRQDVWDNAYKAAQNKLAADAVPVAPKPVVTPTPSAPSTKGPVSEFKLDPALHQFTSGLPNAGKLTSGTTSNQEAAFKSWDAYKNAWNTPEAQAAVAKYPYQKALLEKLNTSNVPVEGQDSLLQKGLNVTESATGLGAQALGAKLLGPVGGAIAGGLAPLVPGVAKDVLTSPAVAPNYADIVPLARVANAEKAYVDAHKAYSQLQGTELPEARWAAYNKLTEAQKAYDTAHDTYQKSLLTQGSKGKSVDELLPDATGQKAPVLSQQGLQESTQGASPSADAAMGGLSNAVGSYFQTMPGMPGASALGAGIRSGIESVKAAPGDRVRAGAHAALEAAPGMLAPAAATLKGFSKFRSPIALLAQSAATAVNQARNFQNLTPEQQDAELQQRLLDESVRSANRGVGGEIGDAATRGLGYLATGDLADTATYLGGKTLGKDSLRSVASEAAAKRFENQKIDNGKNVFAQDPVVSRYADHESSHDAAREYQLYRAQANKAVQWGKTHGNSDLEKKLIAENTAMMHSVAKRLGGKLTPVQEANLQRVVNEYGAGAVERMWRNVSQTVIADDLARGSPVANPQ